MKRLCLALVLGRIWPPLQQEFEHHLPAFVKFSQVQQLVSDGLFTPPSWALRGTGIATLPLKGTASPHLLPLVLIWALPPPCLLLFHRFVSHEQVELDQRTKVTKKQRQGLTGSTSCWTGSAHLVSPH